MSTAQYLNRMNLGDALKVLRELDDDSIDCIITSPPYFNLRLYGAGADEIGIEDTPEAYIARLAEVFREAYRVLKPTGIMWIVVGDSYNGSGKGGAKYGDPKRKQATNKGSLLDRPTRLKTVKRKELIGIPFRLAFALQEDGWYWRSHVVWEKPNAMPESVKDRPTQSHETVLMMTKSERYWYDQYAVSQPVKHAGQHTSYSLPQRRNLRNVWHINTRPLKQSHYAAFPSDLVEQCLLASCPPEVCFECGKPYERILERIGTAHHGGLRKRADAPGAETSPSSVFRTGETPIMGSFGWQRTCKCGQAGWAKGRVLDMFGGAGTVPLVAKQHNRDYIYIDLNPEYVAMAEKRIVEGFNTDDKRRLGLLPDKPKKAKPASEKPVNSHPLGWTQLDMFEGMEELNVR